MNPTMDISIMVFVVIGNCIDNDKWLLRSRTVIEINEPFAIVNFALQNREIRLDSVGIKNGLRHSCILPGWGKSDAVKTLLASTDRQSTVRNPSTTKSSACS